MKKVIVAIILVIGSTSIHPVLTGASTKSENINIDEKIRYKDDFGKDNGLMNNKICMKRYLRSK